MREITRECVAYAFYGIQPEAEMLKSFYGELIEWFSSVECPPEKLGVDAPGFSSKLIGFARGHSRLCKLDFAQVESIEMYSLLPDAEIPLSHWWATASISVDRTPTFVLAARCSVAMLEDCGLTRLIESCIRNLNPAYGIGYHRNHDEGPAFYAIGINYAQTPEQDASASDERESISRWGDVGLVDEVYRVGFLRDVYPLNYLTEPQLTTRVGDQTLQEWISSSDSRGSLYDIENQMTRWKVPTDRIESVRGVLSEAGVIIDWPSYIEQHP